MWIFKASLLTDLWFIYDQAEPLEQTFNMPGTACSELEDAWNWPARRVRRRTGAGMINPNTRGSTAVFPRPYVDDTAAWITAPPQA